MTNPIPENLSFSTGQDESPKVALKTFRYLSIVMPAFNEVFTIRHILKRIQNVRLPMEVIIVDDCSTDGTREILQSIHNDFPDSASFKIKTYFHEKNQGKGAAIRTAVGYATGDIVIIQDADLEYDPTEYPRLIEPILSGHADVVYGSRFRGERRHVQLFWHTVGNAVLTLLSNMLSNLNLTDMETCYKAFKTEIIQSVPIRSNRFGFEPEITIKLAKLRCAIFEVPISYRGRSYSEGKKIGWKDGVAAIYTLLKFWLIDDLYEETAGLRTLRIMEGAGTYNTWLFEKCRPYLGRRILECGSGTGNITKFLRNKDAVVATDIIDFYLQELQRHFSYFSHISVHKFDLTDDAMAKWLNKEYSPDTVLSLNVLEHIEDDKKAFENIYHSLGKDGLVVLVLPAHQALFSKIDKHLGHYRRYTKDLLRERLEQAGFRVEKMMYLNMLGALGWFVNGRLLRKKLLPSRQVRLFDLLIKLLAIENWIDPPFGLSVLAVARKVS